VRIAIFILCWLVMFGAGAGMIAAVLLVDTIQHPGTIQAIIAGSGVLMFAACGGVLASWPPGWQAYF
jgi:hypothetical protein